MDNNDLLFRKPPNRLEKLMEDHEVTLKEVSENTGIPITTLSGYKKNQRAPKKKNAQLLSEYFEVSIPYLLGYEENSTANKPNATISIELVKELYSIREKRSSLHQKYIELDKKEQDILERIRSAVL